MTSKTTKPAKVFRGIGRTTEQLKALANRGVFLVREVPQCNEVKSLCEKLGRTDIKVFTIAWLINGQWGGQHYSAVELDHNLQDTITDQEMEVYNRCLIYGVRPNWFKPARQL